MDESPIRAKLDSEQEEEWVGWRSTNKVFINIKYYKQENKWRIYEYITYYKVRDFTKINSITFTKYFYFIITLFIIAFTNTYALLYLFETLWY